MGIPDDSNLERIFPSLSPDNYQRTSDYTPAYNCIAWAAGSTTEWWWPSPNYYWPHSAPREPTISAGIKAFATLNYTRCSNTKLESGIEKVALYALDNTLTHAARQLEDGNWTSKSGREIDIMHVTLESLCGKEYGEVACFMQRTRQIEN